MAGPTYRGWKFDPVNNRLDFYYNGTRVGHLNTTEMGIAEGLTVAKGIVARGNATGRIREGMTATAIADGGNVTYTNTQLLGGLIVRNPNSGNRTDVLPTAANIAAALPGIAAGDVVKAHIVNDGTTDNTLVVNESTNVVRVPNVASAWTLARYEAAEILLRRVNTTHFNAYIVKGGV